MSGAANAMHRRDAEFSEIGTGVAIAIANPLVSEGIDLAFTKNASVAVERTFGSKHPSVMRVDKDGDGQADTTLRFSYTGLGAVSKIAIDGAQNACTLTKSIARVANVDVDYNNDKQIDTRVKVDRDLFGIPNIEIDTNGDGKPDIRLKTDVGLLGDAKGLFADWNLDGKPDGYIKFKRNWAGNVDRVELRKL